MTIGQFLNLRGQMSSLSPLLPASKVITNAFYTLSREILYEHGAKPNSNTKLLFTDEMKHVLLEWLLLFKRSLNGVDEQTLRGTVEYIVPCEKLVCDTGDHATGGYVWNRACPAKPLLLTYLPLLDSEKHTSSTARELAGIAYYLQRNVARLRERGSQFVIVCDNQPVIRALSGLGFAQKLDHNAVVSSILSIFDSANISFFPIWSRRNNPSVELADAVSKLHLSLSTHWKPGVVGKLLGLVGVKKLLPIGLSCKEIFHISAFPGFDYRTTKLQQSDHLFVLPHDARAIKNFLRFIKPPTKPLDASYQK